MCKCPNYLIWDGSYSPSIKRYKKRIDDPNDKFIALPSDYETLVSYDWRNIKPHYRFLGHITYDKLIDLDNKNIPYIQVPCGQCLECRINQTRVWADRCVLEAKQYEHNYFVTLTYDDDHYPRNGSLSKRECQLFMKRLRSYFPDIKIRYLICGEYGDHTARAHYHAILFNCPLSDLSTKFKLMENGRLTTHDKPYKARDGLFYSDTIAKAWNYQGMISVAHFNYDTAAYVSQYVTKKANPNNKEQYLKLGIEPEFMLMSTHPGIGAQYFDDKNDEFYSYDHIIVASSGDFHRSSVPRYFDKLFIKKYGEDLFNSIRYRRIGKKNIKLLSYINSSRIYDKEAQDKDYHLHKIQRLKTAI